MFFIRRKQYKRKYSGVWSERNDVNRVLVCIYYISKVKESLLLHGTQKECRQFDIEGEQRKRMRLCLLPNVKIILSRMRSRTECIPGWLFKYFENSAGPPTYLGALFSHSPKLVPSIDVFLLQTKDDWAQVLNRKLKNGNYLMKLIKYIKQVQPQYE